MQTKALLFLLLAATACARPAEYSELTPDGGQRFGHDSGPGGYHHANLSPRGSVRGTFGHTEPRSGQSFRTEYSAGRAGFIAQGAHITRRGEDLDLNARLDVPNSKIPPPSRAYDFAWNAADQSRREAADAIGDVRGRYSYVDDVGIRRTVDYIAGQRTGFLVTNDVPDPAVSGPAAEAAYYRPSRRGAPPGPAGTRGYQSTKINADGSYRFTHSSPAQRRTERKDALGRVLGEYSYIDDRGARHRVQYEAGPGIGFRVTSRDPAASGAPNLRPPGSPLLPGPVTPSPPAFSTPGDPTLPPLIDSTFGPTAPPSLRPPGSPTLRPPGTPFQGSPPPLRPPGAPFQGSSTISPPGSSFQGSPPSLRPPGSSFQGSPPPLRPPGAPFPGSQPTLRPPGAPFQGSTTLRPPGSFPGNSPTLRPPGAPSFGSPTLRPPGAPPTLRPPGAPPSFSTGSPTLRPPTTPLRPFAALHQDDDSDDREDEGTFSGSDEIDQGSPATLAPEIVNDRNSRIRGRPQDSSGETDGKGFDSLSTRLPTSTLAPFVSTFDPLSDENLNINSEERDSSHSGGTSARDEPQVEVVELSQEEARGNEAWRSSSDIPSWLPDMQEDPREVNEQLHGAATTGRKASDLQFDSWGARIGSHSKPSKRTWSWINERTEDALQDENPFLKNSSSDLSRNDEDETSQAASVPQGWRSDRHLHGGSLVTSSDLRYLRTRLSSKTPRLAQVVSLD